MMDLSILDILLLMALFASPFALFIIIFIYLINVAKKGFSYVVMLGLIIPQLVLWLTALLGLLWLDLGELARITAYLFSSCFAVLLWAIALANKYLRNLLAVIMTSHLLCLTLTLGLINALEYNVSDQISDAWQTKRLSALLTHASHGNLHELEKIKDPRLLEKLLYLAAGNPVTPAKVVRYLTYRVDSPFEVSAPETPFIIPEDNVPFFNACRVNNITAINIFIEQLQGDRKKAQHNRHLVEQHNPLVRKAYEFAYKKNARPTLVELAQLLLPVMPELLTNEFHEKIIETHDRQLIEWFWQQKQPQDRLLMLKELVIMDKTAALMNALALTPEYLQPGDYAWQSLLAWITRNATPESVEAVLNSGLVNMSLYENAAEGNAIVNEAYRRSDADTPVGRKVLIIVIRNLISQKATLTDRQLLMLLANEQGAETLLAAGIPCDRLHQVMKAPSQATSERDREESAQLLRVCP